MVDVVRAVGLALLLLVPALIVYRTDGRCRTVVVAVRCIVAVLAGYLILNLTSYVYWETAFRTARSEQELNDLAMHDGGPRAFALVLGWVPVAVYVGLLALTRRAVQRLLSGKRRKREEDES